MWIPPAGSISVQVVQRWWLQNPQSLVMTTWALGGGESSESAVNPGEVPDPQPTFSRLSCLLPIFERGFVSQLDRDL